MKKAFLTCPLLTWLVVGLLIPPPMGGTAAPPETAQRFQVPPGFVIEKVAEAPLVRYPLFAALDDRGRLYVAEGTGTNLPGAELLKMKKQLGRILLLEDTNGDGKFDTSKVFADDLTFPTGVLWHNGLVYATSHPNLWRFEDTNGDGRADKREALVSEFRFNGNGCDIHGPFLGPEGRLYWTDGRHGYKIKTREGPVLEGLASRIWRCRLDGTAIERLCGGGFDNPVELTFTAGGEMIGTMDQGPGDALLHYVEGGVYPMEHPCLKEFPMTGPLLGAIRQYTASLPVALCGLTRYRSSHFGPDYQGSLFTTQFNVHRVQQHILTRDGSTYRSVDKDFLTSTDYDVHPTDVLEDADGSLLVVDMGAWFNYGCPTSKIAKPEVLGAIYRIRRQDAPKVADPWGRSLQLAKQTPAELVRLLDDPRPKVRDQVIEQVGKRGVAAVAELAALLRSETKRSVEARRNAVWALCRIASPEARAALRHALADADASVRLAALHAVGVDKDAAALPELSKLVVQEEMPLRLKAAEALGRIGQAAAIPALLESLRKGSDRFLEHALIHALLRINDPQALRPALEDANPRVRQAVLIALDQMPQGQLTREQVIPLLDTDDPDLQQAVLEVVGRRPGWAGEVVGLLRGWLTSPKLSAEQERSLTGILLAYSGEDKIQQLVADTLGNTQTRLPLRLLLLRVLARCRLDTLPASWQEALSRILTQEDQALQREVVATIKARNLKHCDTQLVKMSRATSLPAELRIAVLDCLIARRPNVAEEGFGLLTMNISEKADPLLSVTAARTLGAATLTKPQLTQLAGQIKQAGPMLVPLLLPAYAKVRDAEVGLALVAALRQSPGTDALAVDDLDQVLKNHVAAVQTAAAPLRQRLAARHNEQAAYLTQLTQQLLQTPGNSERGREVFFARKTACYSCHRLGNKGGNVGPDLSHIGRFRTTRDLLEAIVFPSAAIIPDFRAYAVTTKDGRTVTGMIIRETADTLFLRTPQLAEVRLGRREVEEMAPARTSIMPEGLEKTMTRQELSDLLEFLFHQR